MVVVCTKTQIMNQSKVPGDETPCKGGHYRGRQRQTSASQMTQQLIETLVRSVDKTQATGQALAGSLPRLGLDTSVTLIPSSFLASLYRGQGVKVKD